MRKLFSFFCMKCNKMKVNRAIKNYRTFLLSSWDAFMLFVASYPNDATAIEELMNDWLQSKWEILVEFLICEFDESLEVYGNGADCNGASSRVCYPDKISTHKIICKPHQEKVTDLLTGSSLQLTDARFDMFVAWKDNFYSICPPFDYVLLSDNNQTVIVDLNDVDFEMQKL